MDQFINTRESLVTDAIDGTLLASGGRLLHASTTRNGVAWSALRTDDPSHDAFGSKLVSWLTEVRRVV